MLLLLARSSVAEFINNTSKPNTCYVFSLGCTQTQSLNAKFWDLLKKKRNLHFVWHLTPKSEVELELFSMDAYVLHAGEDSGHQQKAGT